MTKSSKLIGVLTAAAVLSGIVLSFLNLYTAPRIEAHQREALTNALDIVLPEACARETRKIGGTTFYFGQDRQDDLSGIAFLAVGNGFQSKLRILIGMDAQFDRIVKLIILEQAETPGLGTKIDTDPTNKQNPGWFTDQFAGLSSQKPITYVKNQTPDPTQGEIAAITGATISSEAVVDIVNEAINQNRELLQAHTELSVMDCAESGNNQEKPDLPPEMAQAEIKEIDGKTFHIERDAKDEIDRVAFIAAGTGFQSRLKLLVCVTPDFRCLLSLKILEQGETPGWGDRIECDTTRTDDQRWFTNQFANLKITSGISCVTGNPDKDKGEIRAISGATISSEAVVNIINRVLTEYRDAFIKQKGN